MENLVIRLTAEVDQAVKEVKDAAKEITTIAPAADKASAATTRMGKTTRDLAAELSRTKQEAEKLSPAVSEIGKTATTAAGQLPEATKKTTTLRSQLSALREEISRLEIAGQTGSKAFQQMSLEAAKLQDQIGDTQARTRALASDTANIDAAIGSFQALASVGQIGAGAMALFGQENEEVGKVLLKLNGIMAITQGIQQTMNLLNKDSIVVLKAQQLVQLLSAKGATIMAAAQRALGIATAATTVQTKILRATLISTGIGAIAIGIGLLIGKIMEWTSATDDNAGSQEKLNQQIELQAKLLDSQKRRISESTDDLLLAAKARGASEKELVNIQRAGLQEQIKLQNQALASAQEGSEAQIKAAEELRQSTRNLSRFELEQKAAALDANKSKAESATKTAKTIVKAVEEEKRAKIELQFLNNGISENIDSRITKEEALKQAIVNRANAEIKAANDALLAGAEGLVNKQKAPDDIVNRAIDPRILEAQTAVVAVQNQLGETLQNNIALAGGLSDAFGSVFEAILSGQNAFDVIKDSIKQMIIQIIRAIVQAAILKALTTAIGGGAFGGSTIGKALLGAFGGGRAGGGTVNPGMSYIVGESGAEKFVPSVPGTIVPNAAMGSGQQLEFVISGNTLRTINNRANQSFNRIGG